MSSSNRRQSVLLCLTGMGIDGGIASVARCMARVMDDEVRAGRLERTDRVLLHDTTATATPPACGVELHASGSKLGFIRRVWQTYRRYEHDLLVFDHYGPARVLDLRLLRPTPPRVAIFTHAVEVRHGRNLGVLRRATHLLANSAFSAGVLRQQVPGGSAHAVHLCIDPGRIDAWSAAGAPDPAAPRERAALIVARMASADGRGKGHDMLLDAWPGVLERCPGAELWIAGRGDDTGRLEQRARGGGLQSSVRFLGQLDADALTACYRRASIYVMPSRNEGFGLAFAEAMWHGLPCVGTTADAAHEVIADGVTGHLVPFGDPDALRDTLVTLWSDDRRRISMGQAGFERVRQRFDYAAFHRNLARALDMAS